jgi:hypothetical protein
MFQSTRLTIGALAGLAALAAGPGAFAAEPGHLHAYGALVREDAFMAIHMDNQKIGSEVYNHWYARPLSGRQDPVDPYMVIHMDNQKIDSAVSAFWRSLAQQDL